jgi:hypothetical protein
MTNHATSLSLFLSAYGVAGIGRSPRPFANRPGDE